MLALLTVWPTLRLSSPVDDAVMVKAAATAPTLTVPVGVISLVDPVILAAGMIGIVALTAVAVAVGVPERFIVTTVALVLTAVDADTQDGSPVTAKSAEVIVAA